MTTTIHNEHGTATLEATSCPLCGVRFAMPQVMLQARRGDKRDFYCPSGHSMSFTESAVDRERARVKTLQAQLTATRDQRDATRQELLAAERSRSALRGVITKERRRVGRGLCPCCGVTFPKLAQHMADQHPEHAEGNPEVATAFADDAAGSDA